jgi:hypothetical protein
VTTLESTTERLEYALRRLAVEAADLFEGLLESGAELPFEIEPTDDSPLPMFQYSPLTGEFIERHVAQLRRLEAFAEVCDIAGEEAAIGFMVGLWDGRTEFEIAGDRLQGAIDGVVATISSEEGDADATPTGEVIVPLIGFHMPADAIVLDGVRIVRADSLGDAPVDAVDATRSGRGGKPGFLARVSCPSANVAPAAAVADDMRRALRTMRLFRPGAVGLGSHGWARRAGGWERFSTGTTRPRQGGYRLTGNEVGELEKFSESLAKRGARLPALAWAASRFELGAERASLIEALSDYLLALRGLLEGGGRTHTALAARVAILVCEPEERDAGRICVERALLIERKLMSGGRFKPTADASPLDVIAELEELLRRLLKGLATGELEGDLRVTADEILLKDGLAVGEAHVQRDDETAEWRIPDPVGDDEGIDLSAIADGHMGEIEVRRIKHRDPDDDPGPDGPDDPDGDEPTQADPPTEPEYTDAGPPREIAHTGTGGPSQSGNPTRIVLDDVELPDIMEPPPKGPFEPEPSAEKDWFRAGDGDGEVEWPAFASPRHPERDRDRAKEREGASDRVRYLFPVPDQTDWDVGELRYERKRRSS